MIQRIFSKVNLIVNAGLQPDMSFADQKKLKLVNGICLYGILVTITFAIVSAFDPNMRKTFNVMAIANVSAFGGAYLLNVWQQCSKSHILLCLYLPSFLAYATLAVPEESAADISILGISILPLFLFEKKRYIIPLVIYCTLAFTAIQIIKHNPSYYPASMVKAHPLAPPYFLGIFFAFLEIYIFTGMFKSEHTRYENTIIEKSTELEFRKTEIELQKQEIISSIAYAKRIQSAILPQEDLIRDTVERSFVLYKPKDIVSGDFFWFTNLDEDSFIIVAADCTGHGVPGAFMTVIGSTLLNQIVVENKVTRPAEILAQLDRQITATLKQERHSQPAIRDGMDMALLKVNRKTRELVYANAKRPAVLIRDKEIQELPASKITIDGLMSDTKDFKETRIPYKEGDTVYLFTDGCTDQFGGPANKKFMIKRLRELLLGMSDKGMNDQKSHLDKALESWIGQNEQTDDILLIGLALN